MIVIAGDSYSDMHRKSCNVVRFNPESISWVRMLSEVYDVTCVARRGSSNRDILKQVYNAPEHSFLIVNMSHPLRTSQFLPTQDLKIESRLNKDIASYFSKKNRTLCWTPFVGYESIKGVVFKPLYKCNEMYYPKLFKQVTSHHLTSEGNEILFTWMKERINELDESLCKNARRT
jgi:hypothetical protein